jgi:SAM-dependent methyltransferase
VSENSLKEWWTYRRYRRLTDDEWRQTLLDSVSGSSKLPMPGFPPEQLQRSYVGQAGADTIEEGWRFYSLMAELWKKHGLRLGFRSHVMDFGCGWGRFGRMFLHDVPGSNIWLVDTLNQALDVCRETGVPGHRVRVEPMPPSPLPSNQFDLVFAFSVFSHLSPMAHLAWRTELSRSMKPGGLAFITTQARWFLDECVRYREHPELQSHKWHEKLANSFRDYDAAVAAYDRGEFLFASDKRQWDGAVSADMPPELAPDYYGEAVVPAAYFEAKWKEAGFELLEFVADRARCEQAVAILRRV